MRKFLTTLAIALMMNSIHAQKYDEIKQTDKNGFSYITVSNDQNGVRVYTLKNGLKVYLAKNTDAPRIQTYIPIRTGSNNDPVDNTGLAHYLEHMMFKGTSKIGTQNWEKEKTLIQQISDLYEQHKAEKDSEKKKAIYKKIDEVSQEASKYAIANEYDKAISSLGATGTNAHTWFDETVYKNNIPSNELEKWFQVEQERFSELVLRLFHTELEAVYEEFNRAQDNDGRLVSYEMMDALFPTHPNGQQTTIGESEHLKNPSMEAIHKYFNEYYVPNNYALVLVGDLDFDKTIQLAEKYFGQFQAKELPKKQYPVEKPMDKVIKRVVKSATTPRLQMAWRSDSSGTKNARLAEIVSQILSTSSASVGLLDLNLNQKQKVLSSSAYNLALKQYGYLALVAVPKENQSLDEAKNLLLEQVDLVKKGEFPDWMLKAIVNDLKLRKEKSLESADGLASYLYNSYIQERTWEQELEDIQEYEKITKEEVVKFANDFFKENYVVVYKERGKNDKLVRVENPGITPIQLNRETQSPFLKNLQEQKVEEIQPQFVDFSKEIKTDKINGKKLSFIENKNNNIASMNYIFHFGTDNDKELSTAFTLLEYLGTDKYSPEEIKQEFFKIGVTYRFQVGTDMVNIMLSGLEENLVAGAKLLDHWLENVKADEGIYKTVVNTILEARGVAKKDKNRIMAALTNYARYGRESRFRDVVSQERLTSAKSTEFTEKVKTITDYPYEIFFYGKDLKKFQKGMASVVNNNKKEAVPSPAKIYPEPVATGKVYFANYDMVQVEMSKVGRGEVVNPQDFGKINVFNEYFGRGLSSIVFQEIREARSLAYSAYVSYARPSELKKHDYVSTYIGTQANKLGQAVGAMNELMANLPQIQAQFDNSKNSALKQIASNRITKQNIYFNYLAMQKLGLNYDMRKDIYQEVQNLSLNQLTNFYNQKIKPVVFNTAIIGKKENLDMNAISQMGELVELSLEEIFGY